MKILYVLVALNPLSPLDPIDQIAPVSLTKVEQLAPLPTYETYLGCMSAAWTELNRTIPRDAPNRRDLQKQNAKNYRCLKIEVPPHRG
jgi:hypothetical protein